MRLGPMELGLILVLVLILFGAGRLPDVFSQLGKAVKNFKDAQTGDKDGAIDVTPDSKKLASDLEIEEVAKTKDAAKQAS
jgi:sec-independent protein translocase protein TatA